MSAKKGITIKSLSGEISVYTRDGKYYYSAKDSLSFLKLRTASKVKELTRRGLKETEHYVRLKLSARERFGTLALTESGLEKLCKDNPRNPAYELAKALGRDWFTPRITKYNTLQSVDEQAEDFSSIIKKEGKVNLHGQTTISIRGAARLLGISPEALSKQFRCVNFSGDKSAETFDSYRLEGVNFSGDKIAQKLIELGFDPVAFSRDGITDEAFSEIIDYYAFDAGDRCTEQAKKLIRTFRNIGIRAWIRRELGWSEEQARKEAESQPILTPEEIQRLEQRRGLKNIDRLDLTSAVKDYLLRAGLYHDKDLTKKIFAQVHDLLNLTITSETSKQIRARIAKELGKIINDDELIRDYFRPHDLDLYRRLCVAAANFMRRDGLDPIAAIEKAKIYTLPANFTAKPLVFEKESIRILYAIESGAGRLKGGKQNKAIADSKEA